MNASPISIDIFGASLTVNVMYIQDKYIIASLLHEMEITFQNQIKCKHIRYCVWYVDKIGFMMN